MTSSEETKGKSVAFLYYLFAFMLLWEWLRPLNDYTDTANTFIFILFIGLSFLLTFLKTKWYVNFPVKIFLILFILHGLFFEGVFFQFLWIKELGSELVYNLQLIPQADWVNMTPSFRTLLFFILLWLLVYLIHYWILVHRRIFFFFGLTLLYITILDTFTGYDATFAIVRTVLIGFFMLGLLYFDRLKKVENLKLKKTASLRWVLPLLAFIMVSMVLAVLAPKASPQWPDPVPYITAVGREEEEGGTKKKIGYSQNDEKLGGGFVEDDSEVFTHVSTDRHYWRVETKDVYTGKGWEVSNPESELEEITDLQQELTWIDDRVVTKELEATVTIQEDYKYFHVIYPLGLTALETEMELPLYVNRTTEQLSPFAEGEGSREEFSVYEVDYKLPVYPLNEMKKEQVTDSLSEEFLDRYTQLPDTLPERVKQLAEKITVDDTNQYDKAKSIEEYLGSIIFTYDKEDVAIPGENEDYVDQFLFDTQKGYCDNFSTSMIVLLRSLDIPARWVKGYTGGEYIRAITNFEKEYRVTNNNAHSWVEVYFEGVGWVPFEPTQGFVNPYDVTDDYENAPKDEEEKEETTTPDKEEEEETPPKPDEEEKEQEEEAASPFAFFDLRIGSVGLYMSLVVLILLGVCLYLTRLRWISRFLLYKYRGREDEVVFFQAYQSLLKQYERMGVKRKPNQTLREYARYIDHYFQMVHMSTLTERYEKALYRRDSAKDEWKQSVELWENLIKRTSS
ncbi:DUF4129 domain-containing transglutaminase family protein [Bacillus weihaiensis]|nr:transglutaminase domain-containing protein [Bacillus weihaiensis]